MNEKIKKEAAELNDGELGLVASGTCGDSL